jgi:TonB-linked SusC/RagA family outer membrane protein
MRKITTLLLCMFFGVSSLLAQNRTITGKVTDEKGAPLSGASIQVDGTKIGVVTASDGSFSISVPASAKNINISALDFARQKMAIGGKSNLQIKLENASKEIEAVLVQVPYGTVKKIAFTGSESTVSASQISKQQVTSVTNALDGLIPGIVSTNGGGQPGDGGARIRVRGFGSINASNAPLYVLNGVPYDGDISAISNDDIESVSVLKDAAAASLYGSRAANGVVMITTKKGKKGKLNVSLNVRHGFLSRGIPEYDRLAPKTYYETAWESNRNGLLYAPNSAETVVSAGRSSSENLVRNVLGYNAYNVKAENLLDPITGKLNPSASLIWKDSWEEELFKKAGRTNVGLSISGAGDKSDFFISAGFLDEKGIAINSGFKRYNFRVNVNSNPLSWLNTGLNLDAAFTQTAYSPGGDGTNNANNPFSFTRSIASIYPVYARDTNTGKLIVDANGYSFDYGNYGLTTLDPTKAKQRIPRAYLLNTNPIGSNTLDVNANEIVNANANTFLEIKFLENFSFKTSVGMNLYESRYKRYYNKFYGDAAGVGGRTTISSDRSFSLTANQVLNWNKSFSKHNFRMLAGHENYFIKYNFLDATRTNNKYHFLNELDSDSTNEGAASSYEDNLRMESYFSGLNYDFDGKYLFSASVRTDGSSRFSASGRWGTFYSFGLGWRISEEKFMQSVKWVNDLKFRASYGEQGNENLGTGLNYYIDRQWYASDNNGGFKPQTIKSNSSVKWEGNRVTNIGFDFSLFNRRLQGTIEYFSRYTTNMLFKVPVSPTSGYLNEYQNVGELNNSGIELSLGYNVIRSKNFDWRIDFNLTSFKNKMISMPKIFQDRGGFLNGDKKISVGHSIYDFWLREFAGVDASNGLALYYQNELDASKKETGKRFLTTDPTKASFYYNGSAIPDFTGGLTNSFRFKNFELSCLLSFSYGGKYYDGNYAGLMHSGNLGTAWHTDILNRWQKPGDITNVPRLQANSGLDIGSTRFLFDGSYINIKNITATFQLPKSISDRMKISGVNVFASIDNVLYITSKKGNDPQNAFDGSSGSAYTPYRSVTFGFNFRF